MGGENRPHGPIFAFAARFVTGCNGRSAKLRAHTFISGLGEVLGKPERVCGCAMFLIMFQPLTALGDGGCGRLGSARGSSWACPSFRTTSGRREIPWRDSTCRRSEEHTSELQSRRELVCRL